MARARASQPEGFSRRVSVETPEHVLLEFELAGFGSRIAAAAYDLAIQAAIFLVVVFMTLMIAPRVFSSSSAGWLIAVFGVVGFAVMWGYGTLHEGLTAGLTPGKRRVGIRVVTDTGHPITLGVAAVRNLLRIVDAQPFGSFLIGLLLLFFQRHSRRLGDMVAGTMVVRDEPEQVGLAFPESAVGDAVQSVDLGSPLLPDSLYHVVEQFVRRMDALDRDARQRVLTDLAARVSEFVPREQGSAEAFLLAVYTEERAKRHAKSATRSGAGQTKAAGSTERFVTVRRPGWESFKNLATGLSAGGMSAADGAKVLAFAREYRAVATDLARARTYGVDRRVLQYLERIVGTGHNALYGMTGVKRIPLGRLMLRELPGAVYGARRFILFATLAFLLPGIAGYTVIREQPTVAQTILPSSIVGRAEAGADDRRSGLGYAETPSPYLPMFASSIITNNVQVAFAAFALGALAGVGTLAVLAFNGLFFGAVMALFANYGLAGWILTFVAGHGVLELTAIFIAGAAGLLIGHAIIAPGDLARRDALIVSSRAAIRLVGASASLLVIAGLIEGFLSASSAPAALKLGVAAASIVVVGLIFVQGRIVSQ